MFGLGFTEILIILVLALVLLGPQRLPDVAKHLGKGLRDFRKATEDLKRQFETEFYAEDDRPARPALVPRPAPQPAAQPPAATAENVPGLDAATAEPAPPPTPPGPAAPASESP